MRIVADLHNHSRFSRACSPDLTLPNLEKWGEIKGVNLLTTADFTHPRWIKECEEQLQAEGNGFYHYRGGRGTVHFIFTTELSFIYKQGERTRRVHNVVLAPHLEAVKKLNAELDKRGFNRRADGRPILGISDRDFLEMIKGLDDRFEVIPAHIWTPWFSIFGSKSGFDSVAECYGDMSKYIFALETGLSSDPLMNYRLSTLDKYILVSNSDSHSLKNIGREANVFEIDEQDLSYDELIRILREKDVKKFLYTIEFFPEEGRYHYDGHRDCNVVLPPQQTKKLKGRCPVCHKELTLGVEYRVNELADRPLGAQPPSLRPGFHKVVELDKIIADCLGVKGRQSQKVLRLYEQLIKEIGNELYILLEAGDKELARIAEWSPLVAEAIRRVRSGHLDVQPGYDGVYGEITIYTDREKERFQPQQKQLFG